MGKMCVDYNKNIGNVYFRLYDKFDIFLPIKDWDFLCKKRWFSDNPDTEIAEAEFGLYGARNAEDNNQAVECVKRCVTDLRDIMDPDTKTGLKEQCNKLLNSDISTLLTFDSNGNLIAKRDNT